MMIFRPCQLKMFPIKQTETLIRRCDDCLPVGNIDNMNIVISYYILPCGGSHISRLYTNSPRASCDFIVVNLSHD